MTDGADPGDEPFPSTGLLRGARHGSPSALGGSGGCGGGGGRPPRARASACSASRPRTKTTRRASDPLPCASAWPPWRGAPTLLGIVEGRRIAGGGPRPTTTAAPALAWRRGRELGGRGHGGRENRARRGAQRGRRRGGRARARSGTRGRGAARARRAIRPPWAVKLVDRGGAAAGSPCRWPRLRWSARITVLHEEDLRSLRLGVLARVLARLGERVVVRELEVLQLVRGLVQRLLALGAQLGVLDPRLERGRVLLRARARARSSASPSSCDAATTDDRGLSDTSSCPSPPFAIATDAARAFRSAPRAPRDDDRVGLRRGVGRDGRGEVDAAAAAGGAPRARPALGRSDRGRPGRAGRAWRRGAGSRRRRSRSGARVGPSSDSEHVAGDEGRAAHKGGALRLCRLPAHWRSRCTRAAARGRRCRRHPGDRALDLVGLGRDLRDGALAEVGLVDGLGPAAQHAHERGRRAPLPRSRRGVSIAASSRAAATATRSRGTSGRPPEARHRLAASAAYLERGRGRRGRSIPESQAAERLLDAARTPPRVPVKLLDRHLRERRRERDACHTVGVGDSATHARRAARAPPRARRARRSQRTARPTRPPSLGRVRPDPVLRSLRDARRSARRG